MREPRPDIDLLVRMNSCAICVTSVGTCLEHTLSNVVHPLVCDRRRRTVLWCGSPGELSAVLDWLSHAPSVPSDVGASCWALGETGEPFEYLLRNLERIAQRLRADKVAVA